MNVAIRIDGHCTGCGMCIATCPERALWPGAKRPLANAHVCTVCLACVEVCPVDAIAVSDHSITRAAARP